MKRLLCILLALVLSLGLCACGATAGEPAPTEIPEGALPTLPAIELWPSSKDDPAATPKPTPDLRPYHVVEITPDNWYYFFQLREIPLYSINSSGVIAQVCQTYCVVLREEYQDQVISDGDYRVEFSFTFDVYYNTLDVDTQNFRYGHTNDFGYPDAPVYGQGDGGGHTAPMKEATATKSASYDRYALRFSAYGTDYSRYHGYSNAFFGGWANINMESKVWSGFYIDLNQVRLESVSGYLQIAD